MGGQIKDFSQQHHVDSVYHREELRNSKPATPTSTKIGTEEAGDVINMRFKLQQPYNEYKLDTPNVGSKCNSQE